MKVRPPSLDNSVTMAPNSWELLLLIVLSDAELAGLLGYPNYCNPPSRCSASAIVGSPFLQVPNGHQQMGS